MSGVTIAFEPGEGAVVRMLGLVERRGFEVRSIVMSEGMMTLDVKAQDASRSLDVLDLQLRRLVDVRDVQVAA